jgi:hypothetical protein
MRRLLFAFLLCSLTSVLQADPPTDPKARKIYDHDKEWLSHFPSSFVATNIRGEGNSYAERRMAALDLVRQQRDFGVVSELMDELNKNSFLSGEICDILGEWKARRALPLLKQIAADASRAKEVREKAKKAADAIEGAPTDHPPSFNEQGAPTSSQTNKP